MAGTLDQRNVIVGVSGGIACFKAAALVSQLAQQGAHVSVVMTSNALRFVGQATFAALAGQPVLTEVFDERFPLGAHVELAQRGELLVVAPATANLLAKFANGHADDLLTTLYLAFQQKVAVAPAMNAQMWEHPAVQRNLNQIRDDGVHIIEPGEGWLSCRVKGVGRMAEPDMVLEEIHQLLEN